MGKRKPLTQEQKKINAVRLKQKRDKEKQLQEEAYVLKIMEMGVNPAKRNTGLCIFEECVVKLSRYNDTQYCSKHHRIAVQNGLVSAKEFL